MEDGGGSYEGTNLVIKKQIYNLFYHDGGIYCFLHQHSYGAIVIKNIERID